MKLTRLPTFAGLKLALALLLATTCWTTARAQIYIAYSNVGMISEYDQQTGALITEQFVLGLKKPRNLCIANGVLYVLQTDGGSVGTYDLHTGAPLRPELITGLNNPEAMTVSSDAIYVSEFDWQTGQPHVGKYNAFTGAAINAALITITGAVINGMTMTPSQPMALAVTGTHLFVSHTDGPSSANEYDTTTGTLIKDKVMPMLFPSDFFLLNDKWLWLVAGSGSSAGVIFKVNTETGESAAPAGGPFIHPFMNRLDHPWLLAVSGDDLFLAQERGTGVAKYNATSGEIINANFIPSKGDFMGGLAVMPRAVTADEASADSQFEFKQSIGHVLFMMAVYWQYTFVGTCLVLLLFVCGILALVLRHRAPAPGLVVAEPAVEEAPAPAEVIPAATIADESPVLVHEEVPVEPPAPVEPTPAPSQGFSAIAIVAFLLLGVTLATAGVLAYLILVPPDIYGMPKPETDMIGIWGFDSGETGQADEKPVMRDFIVYPTHAIYSEGNGPHDIPGKWHDNGFWVPTPDGSSETEVARLIDPLDMEVHVSAFIPSQSDVLTLYKTQGSAAERAAIAAKYPAPLKYPPPKGVVTYNMTEYDLDSLPWRVDYIEAVGDQPYDRGTLFHYHSDDPKIPPLEVTVKLRHVVEIHGGYE